MKKHSSKMGQSWLSPPSKPSQVNCIAIEGMVKKCFMGGQKFIFIDLENIIKVCIISNGDF